MPVEDRRSLAAWLSWQESLNVRSIDLGLERVAEVRDRLLTGPVAPRTIVVAGTNGKGSSVAFLEALLSERGWRVGAYTSPHLVSYTERLRIEGVPVSESSFCEAFERVEVARGDVPLTYFEFGTLAAFDLLQRSGVAAAVLEVGLGGRLDAVNVVDGDAALITRIGLDHQEWLGDDLESIGREKAGILRAGRWAVSADPDSPRSIRSVADESGARLIVRGIDYQVSRDDAAWAVESDPVSLDRLPLPGMSGPHQIDNAAGALMVLGMLGWLPERTGIERALVSARAPGRLQRLGADPARYADVGHNPDAAEAIAGWLRAKHGGQRVHLVLGMLGDKDAPGFLAPLRDLLASIRFASLPGLRGRSARALAEAVGIDAAPCHETVLEAWAEAVAGANADDVVLAAGSFLTAAEVIHATQAGG